KAGLALDPAALGDLNAAPLNAIVSIGGCSASFVSPDGLVATNHHCVTGSLQVNSKPGANLLADGFLAKEMKDELPTAPGTRVFVIEKLENMTSAILAGVTDATVGAERIAKIEKNRKDLVAKCEAQPNRRCDAQYWLQQMLEIKDVRLVYAPASGVGNFGGEVDNWQWPRHTGDFSFYRAYVAPDGSSAAFDVKNVPFKPKAHLKIAKEGLKTGDYVMVAGFPGTTDRLRTAAEADFYYAKFYPKQQQLLSDYADAIVRATSGDEAATIKYASILRGADNIKKKLIGQMAGADAVQLSSKKAGQEKAFRDWAKSGARASSMTPVIAALDDVAKT
ncbi:MAG: S46 family peptidase, partial [Parvularculaceae bacterium]|nr:S46 family peptidase [Parvularculaceae bacterium]